jgi:heme/copper-type cytochrome/quinol oxidase subunit 1
VIPPRQLSKSNAFQYNGLCCDHSSCIFTEQLVLLMKGEPAIAMPLSNSIALWHFAIQLTGEVLTLLGGETTAG